MLCACDFCCGDGPTFQGGKQNTAEGVPNGVTVTGFEWLGSKFCVGICGCALVLTESFRHFKTTVTDWHLQFSNVDFRLAIEDRGVAKQSKIEIPSVAGFPLASAASHPAMETQGPTA